MNYNYKIKIEYLGEGFVGWQIQKNGKSIQNAIEKAIFKVIKKKIRINGSGRTDAGVNAIEQCANFYSEKKIKNKSQFIQSINFFLNEDPISIKSLEEKNLNFHARFSAKKRQYEYIIVNRSSKLVIDKNRSWLVRKLLNLEKMKKAAKYLLGTHNFSTFRSSTCSAKSPIKKINKFNIKKVDEKIIFMVESKSFLQTQVRSMVGCLKYVGENKWKPEKIKEIIKLKNRKFCAPPAPAQGLYLKKVFY